MYTLIDGVNFYDKNEVDDLFVQNGHTGLSDRIDQEAADRQAGDDALNALIQSEAANRQADNTALNDKLLKESNMRLLGDQTLANQVTAVEHLWSTLIMANFIDTDNNNIVSDDSGKSVRQIAHDEFYRQLVTDADDVKQQLDTLKELADYLQDNPTVLTDIYTKLGTTWSLDNPTDFGTFDFSNVLAATDIDSAILELYNTFNTKLGDLAQLTTAFKNNIVGAINELDDAIKTKKHQDVLKVVFTVDPHPTILPDDTHLYTCDGTDTAYDEILRRVQDDKCAVIGVIDVAPLSKFYCVLQQVLDDSLRFSSSGVYITNAAQNPVYDYYDMTINWVRDGTITIAIKRNHIISTIEKEVARIDVLIGDITTLNTVDKTDLVAAINSEFEWRRKNDETETKAREAADNTLQANIDAEAAARQAKDSVLQAALDALPVLTYGAFSMTGLAIANGDIFVSRFLDRVLELARQQMKITYTDGHVTFGIVANTDKRWRVYTADKSKNIYVDSGYVALTWSANKNAIDVVYTSTKDKSVVIMRKDDDMPDGNMDIYSLDDIGSSAAANDQKIRTISIPFDFRNATNYTGVLNQEHIDTLMAAANDPGIAVIAKLTDTSGNVTIQPVYISIQSAAGTPDTAPLRAACMYITSEVRNASTLSIDTIKVAIVIRAADATPPGTYTVEHTTKSLDLLSALYVDYLSAKQTTVSMAEWVDVGDNYAGTVINSITKRAKVIIQLELFDENDQTGAGTDMQRPFAALRAAGSYRAADGKYVHVYTGRTATAADTLKDVSLHVNQDGEIVKLVM